MSDARTAESMLRNWPDLALRAHETAVRVGALERLAGVLGVDVESLVLLVVGWLRRGGCWTFPMRGVAGEIVGLRTRFANGDKKAVFGSVEGWFGPEVLLGRGPLLIVEGASDAAAGGDMAVDCVGRASARSRDSDDGIVKRCTMREVVVVPDRDRTGLEGARSFAERLLAHGRPRSVRWLLPPSGVKDLRQWRLAGLTRDEMLQLIAATQPMGLRHEVTT